MISRFIIAFVISFPTIGISQTLGTLNSIVQISEKSSTEVDSVLSVLGFQNTSIEGLKFKYNKKSEVFVLQTMPRQITYTFTDKAAYLKINSEVSSQGYELINAQDEIAYNQKSKTVSTFQKETIKISFGTDYNESSKITTYCIWLTNSNPKYLNTPVKIEEVKQAEVIKETSPEVKTPKVQPILFGSLNPKPKTVRTEVNSDSTILLDKNRITLGVGMYKTTYTTYSEILYNFQVGSEISFAQYMKKKKNYFVDTRIDLDACVFLDMQKYYPTTFKTMFLTKYYFTIGMISEVRKKKNAFLMSVAPGLNWTTGKIDSERASFITPTVHFGEYVQRYFGTSKSGKDKMFLRLGFDQYFSIKGGYIGSFGLTLGF
jgi:hypothetical protein